MSTTLRPLPRNTIIAVAGVSHRQPEVQTVAVGDVLVLRHDTSNPADPLAVSVETVDGRVLGFVPRAHDQNARLAQVTPGGVWAATVTDVLTGGDTTGLRVRVGDLISRTDGKFGATLSGLRHRTDGYFDPHDPTRAPDPTPEPVPGAPAAPIASTPRVYTSSGRLLGLYVETAGNKVRVRNGSVVTAYPAAVVRIHEPEPAQQSA